MTLNRRSFLGAAASLAMLPTMTLGCQSLLDELLGGDQVIETRVNWGRFDGASLMKLPIRFRNELERTIEIDGVFWSTDIYMLNAPSDGIVEVRVVEEAIEVTISPEG